LADRLGEALQEAGISTDEPAGDRFDPAQHEAGSATPAGDPEQVGTIAAVEVPGYTDRGGRVLRAPVVTVYQSGASQPAGSTSAGSELAGSEDATEPRHRAKEDR
jgi:molecular chaperone GrpE (heat shock protein)